MTQIIAIVVCLLGVALILRFRMLAWPMLAFVAGAIGGWCAAFGFYLASVSWFGVVDRDGGGAMAYGFIIGPAVGLVLGVVLAIVTAMRLIASRRPQE